MLHRIGQVSATPTLAIPVLELLMSIIALPLLYSGFVEQQYLAIFGIALPYTDPSKLVHFFFYLLFLSIYTCTYKISILFICLLSPPLSLISCFYPYTCIYVHKYLLFIYLLSLSPYVHVGLILMWLH